MTEPRQILFRAKLKDWKTNPDRNKWVEGYYCLKKPYCYDNRTEPSNVIITEFSLTGIVSYEIDPNTLCEFIGWTDGHKTKIYENDIVEIVSSPKRSYKYLIWWNKEMSLMDAANLDSIYFNDNDYSDGNPKFHYSDFCLMLQDPYGDFSDIKVIGNLIDNEEIVKEKLNDKTIM